MIAFRKTAAAFGAELVTLAAPSSALADGEVLIDVAAAGICGSDIHAYEWTSGYEFMTAAMPVTIGHEFSGTVRAVGQGVTSFKRGDRVVCWPTVTCGKCRTCTDRRAATLSKPSHHRTSHQRRLCRQRCCSCRQLPSCSRQSSARHRRADRAAVHRGQCR